MRIHGSSIGRHYYTIHVRMMNRSTAFSIKIACESSCPPEGFLDPFLPIECPAKTLIRLRGCECLSESSLGSNAKKIVPQLIQHDYF